MTCPEAQERLTEHVLNEGAAADQARVEEHVAGCADCAAERDALRRTVGLLASNQWTADVEVLSADRRKQLLARAVNPPRRASRGLRVAVGVAAAVVLGLTVATFMTPWLLPGPRPLDMARARAVDPRHTPLPATPLPGTLARSSPGTVAFTAGVAGRDEITARLFSYDSHDLSFDVRSNPLAPPNGAPVHDMHFEHAGTNPFVETAEDALSTFGLDVDTASYSITRSYLSRGALPPPAAVRVEEFVNAFPQDYAADPAKAFTVHLEAAPNPFHEGYHLLRIGIKAREVVDRERKPVVLTFVIDVSGSMAMENRLGLVKRSLRLLVDRLDGRDRIGLVVYGTRGRVILEPTPVSDPATIREAIDGLETEGSTNLEEGLDLGYAMARRAFAPGSTNRVVLCTDGVANNGVTDAATLLKQIHGQAEKGVDLIALGFGMGNYNDVLLQKLADEGDGQYAYIDDYPEAERFFGRELTRVLEVVARDAKAQVEFDPTSVERYRLIGYEKREVADEKFRDDKVDGGEVNSGHTVTILYEVKLKEGASGSLGAVHLRYADPDSGQVSELRDPIAAETVRPSFAAATPRFRLAAIVARFAEHLRKSYWVKGERLSRVQEATEQLPETLRREPQTAELLVLVRRALALEAKAPDGR